MRTARGHRRRKLGRPPGPRVDAAARRVELLDAAARAIRGLGPNASMDDIAHEAGVTKPILYAHFGDKAGLASALSQRFAAELVPAVLAAFEADVESFEMVRRAIDTFIGFVEEDPALYRFLARGVAGSESGFVDQELVTAFGLRLAQILRGGLRNAGTDSGPAELWAFSILGAAFAGAEWWLARPTMSRADLVEYLADLVWNGASRAAIVPQQITAGNPNERNTG